MWRELLGADVSTGFPSPPPSPRGRGGQKALALIGVLGVALTGCTVHPQGESHERQAAADAGKSYSQTWESRQVPQLPTNPTPDELVNYAMHANAELEQRYWEWRAAIEQVTQDGTQPTNLTINASSMIDKGKLSWDRTTLGIGNDPMADILWPSKLSVAAQRSLENARAAGIRFQKAGYELRANVLAAYYDYALTAELIRIEQSTTELLAATASVVEARNRAGSAAQQDVLRAQNELDMSRNGLANMQSQLPAMRAAINALLGREATAPLPEPEAWPATHLLTLSDDQILAWAADRNPELRAVAAEIRGKQEGIRLARLQYYPDFSISASTDLAGLTQTLLGAVTVPLVRAEAIRAGVAQAEANLRVAESMRRQNANDLAARTLGDLLTVRDADRQLALIDESLLPRGHQIIDLTRAAYESGRAPLLDLLDGQRSLLTIERLAANLRATREKRFVALEAVAARSLHDVPPAGNP